MAKRRRKDRNWLKIGCFLILLVVAGVVCYLVYSAYFKEEVPELEPETPVVETEVIEDGMGGAGEEVEEETPTVEKEEIVQYEGENPNVSAELTGIVTYAEVLDGVLRVRVNIDQFLASGSCELSLVRGGASIYNISAPITQSASTATCQGFDVPVAGLSGGAVQIVINLNAEGKTGVISGEVVL